MTEAELSEAIDHYYVQLYRIQLELNTAALRRAQYFYTGGALLGVVGFSIIATACAGIAWLLGHSIHARPVAIAFGCAISGALGATASVSWRASLGSLNLDPAAGIGALPRLGSLRPSLGAIFGLAIYFGLKSGVIEIGQAHKSFYFFGFFSFVAGFSERALPDLIRRAEHRLQPGTNSNPLSSPEAPKYPDYPDASLR
jgi:hypothetical protein